MKTAIMSFERDSQPPPKGIALSLSIIKLQNQNDADENNDCSKNQIVFIVGSDNVKEKESITVNHKR